MKWRSVQSNSLFAENNASSLNHRYQFSSLYIVQITLGVDHSTTFDRTEISSRLSDVVGDALEKRAITHLQQDAPVFSSKKESSSLKVLVEIVNVDRGDLEATVSFVVFVNKKLVPADVILQDLSLLPLTHISARLQYPVAAVLVLTSVKETYQSRWWLIALIVGSGALLLLCGWILLVVYFNTCGSPSTDYEPRKYNVTEISKAVELSERTTTNPPQVVNPRSKCTRAEQEEQDRRVKVAAKREKTQAPKVKLRAIVETEHEEFTDKKPIEDPIESDVDLASDSSDKCETCSSEKEQEMPHSDEDISECERRMEKRRLRPKSAAPKRPLRTLEGSIIEPIQPTKELWNPYCAGDQIAQIFYIGATLNGHPSPAPSTEKGIMILSDIDKNSPKPFSIL
ncbi:hypothetical protein QR680_001884 [Steinernema hermaphroditum]|uniref:SEA domain-containing protein n=1 Tax=Steinernema hermaphroditum TaxID=289476 RepID=A0AA39H1Y9_9BILA|nr:hypothetical protein QR680_001884 [Steinernema hermaphroditum]